MVERFLARACDDRLLAARREEALQAEEHPGVIVDHEHPRHLSASSDARVSIGTDPTPAASAVPTTRPKPTYRWPVPCARYRPSRDERFYGRTGQRGSSDGQGRARTDDRTFEAGEQERSAVPHRRRLWCHAAVARGGGAHRTDGHHGPGAR